MEFYELFPWECINFTKFSKKIAKNSHSYNPGTMKVLNLILQKYGYGYDTIKFFYHCEELELYDWKIWAAYKHYCDKKIDSLFQSVLSKDRVMITTINRYENIYKHIDMELLFQNIKKLK